MTERIADASPNTVAGASVPESYWTARRGAAFIGLSSRGRIVLTGADRASYLQGLLTNDIEALKPGEGCYALLLTPQGRVMADMNVFNLGEEILLDVHESVTELLVERFQEFVFTEDVKVEDRTESWTVLAVHGPDAARLVAELVCPTDDLGGDRCSEYRHARGHVDASPVVVARSHEIGEIGFQIFVRAEVAAPLRASLADAGALPLQEEMFNLLRLESGRPAFPADLDSDTIPLEAGIEGRAISQSKGCYVGQEVIIRILHRGHGRVGRRLVRFSFPPEADPPEAGSAVMSADRPDGEPVGFITTSAFSPAIGRPIALGYVKRDLADPGSHLIVTTEDNRIPASVVSGSVIKTGRDPGPVRC